LAVARGSSLVCIPESRTSWAGSPRISSSSLNQRHAEFLVLNCVTESVRVCVTECVVCSHKEIHLTYSLKFFFYCSWVIYYGPF
jgi:hypothetical protein